MTADLTIPNRTLLAKEFESIFEKRIGIPTVKPTASLLVTPLGIAMNA